MNKCLFITFTNRALPEVDEKQARADEAAAQGQLLSPLHII